jgi:hypothetical protein
MSIKREHVINKLIDKYNLKNPYYLEIGVQYGSTFLNVNSTNKDGVDPCIYGNYDFINFKMTSDDFFANHIQKKYDIIFIDGLHTAYQVSKDIYNSLNNLNEGGFIILDDVYPHKESEQYCYKYIYDGPQTGDVWKAVYEYLNTFIEITDEIIFIKNTMRGNLVLKIKENNKKNITIDTDIPTCNIDGKCSCNNCEYKKYDYNLDFTNYMSKLSIMKNMI